MPMTRKRLGFGCATAFAAGGALLARFDDAADLVWSLRGPLGPAGGAARAPETGLPETHGRAGAFPLPAGIAAAPAAAAASQCSAGLFAGAAFVVALTTAVVTTPKRRARAAGRAAYGMPKMTGASAGAEAMRAVADAFQGMRFSGGAPAERPAQNAGPASWMSTFLPNNLGSSPNQQLPQKAPQVETAPVDNTMVFLNTATEMADSLKERILDRRVKKAEGSAEKAAALSAKLERIARLQGRGHSPGPVKGPQGFSGGTAKGLQAGTAGPTAVKRAAAAVVVQPPSEMERAASAAWEQINGAWKSAQEPPARAAAAAAGDEAKNVAGMAMQGFSWASKAIFGEAPTAAAAAPEPRREPQNGLAWAGKALFGGAAPPPVQQAASPAASQNERTADQWARIKALDDRHARIMDNHAAFLEKLRNY